MSLTTGQLQSMSFGYLSGADLLQYAAPQLLISQFEKDNLLLNNGCNQAFSTIVSKLSNRYNVALELAKNAPIPAQAGFTIVAGVITAMNVSFPGVNYATAPTIQITGGGGTGATATATVVSGVVTAITVTNGGTGYTSTPAAIFTGGLAADTRSVMLVKITAMLALKSILASLTNIGTVLTAMMKEADSDLKEVQNGQSSLPLQASSMCTQGNPELVYDSFLTIG